MWIIKEYSDTVYVINIGTFIPTDIENSIFDASDLVYASRENALDRASEIKRSASDEGYKVRIILLP